jgi:hypothetical protein
LSAKAAEAREYLQRVIQEHPDTPWALLARRELDTPFGWDWVEQYTDLTPRPRLGGGAGGGGGGGRGVGAARPAVENRPVKRPVPKL